ncbi:MAG: hypothetical protein AAGP08_15450 [Pseudomonadota bacterium]
MTIRSVMIALPLMALGWLGTLVAVGLVSDAAPGQVVVFPSTAFLEAIPSDVAVLGANAWSITLSAGAPDFALSLYQSGAWLVLPAGLPGCLPMPKSPAPNS